MFVPRKDLVRPQKEGSRLQAKEGDLKEFSPANAMTLAFQPMELWEIIFCQLSHLVVFRYVGFRYVGFRYVSLCWAGVHAQLLQSCRTLLWTIVHQAPLSVGFSRQEYWSRLPFPPPGNLLNPGTEPESPVALALQPYSLPLSHW